MGCERGGKAANGSGTREGLNWFEEIKPLVCRVM